MAVVVKWLTQRIVAPSLARSNRVSRPSSGDDSDVEIPVPIPNTEVKHINADDSRKAKIGSCHFIETAGRLFFCACQTFYTDGWVRRCEKQQRVAAVS